MVLSYVIIKSLNQQNIIKDKKRPELLSGGLFTVIKILHG